MYNKGHCAWQHHAGNAEQIYFQNSFPRFVWPRDNFPFKIVAPVPFSVVLWVIRGSRRIVAEKVGNLYLTTQRIIFYEKIIADIKVLDLKYAVINDFFWHLEDQNLIQEITTP